MTIKGMIDKVNELKPNGIADQFKLDWIVELIEQIKTEVWDTHEGTPEEEDPLFNIWKIEEEKEVYTEDDEIDIPDTFIKMFEYYLYAKIDLTNGDFDRYDNSLVLYNDSYAKYKRWYHRSHMPKGNLK